MRDRVIGKGRGKSTKRKTKEGRQVSRGERGERAKDLNYLRKRFGQVKDPTGKPQWRKLATKTKRKQ